MVFEFKKGADERSQFLFGTFWRNDDCRELSVLEVKDVVLAVDKAYIDMTPRTITGLGLSEDKIKSATKKSLEYKDLINSKINLIQVMKENLAKLIVEKVFKVNKFDDTIHHELCDNFISDFQNKIDTLNNQILSVKKLDDGIKRIDRNKITYGKAQKIVNMAMKYLYFFDDAITYKNTVFEKCHMAIDEYIMKYFDKTVGKRNVSNWSNFTEQTYMDYQQGVKAYCDTQKKKPFFAEFEYWNIGRKL